MYELTRSDGFGEEVKRRIMIGTYVLSSGYQDAYYKKAQKVRSLIIKEFQQQFQHCNIIAMPVTPTPAFPLGSVPDGLEMYLADIFTIPANLAGLPAASVPSGFTHSNKPMGIQFIGAQMHDQEVCQLAYAFSQSSKYYRYIPNQN